MSNRNYLIIVVVLIVAFSAFSYYIGSKNQQNTNNITNQSGEPDFINLANPGNGIQENGGLKPANKTNHTNPPKNNTTN